MAGLFSAYFALACVGQEFFQKGIKMATNNDIQELFNRYTRIEHEIKLLQEDKKQLLAEFKERVDAKTFQTALRSAKAMAKLKPTERQSFDQILHVLEKELCLEHID
tara:strand:- start:310 stop:630 length:321 start_codon:yes stop_codon:yes gene_type:complete